MGCMQSKEDAENKPVKSISGGPHYPNFTRPKRFSLTPRVTRSELKAKREEFWHTQPSYGGQREIWEALKAAVEAEDVATARLIVESAGIIVATPHATTVYDERGSKYDIPKWVMEDPDNLAPEQQQQGETGRSVATEPSRGVGAAADAGAGAGAGGGGGVQMASSFQVVV